MGLSSDSAGQTLSERMKDYENCSRIYLPKRLPVVIRVDGKSFHFLTKNLAKPWDDNFRYSMIDTAIYLCKSIDNVKIGYVQSDEISLILSDKVDNKYNRQPWFGNNLQKIASVSASMAASQFMFSYIFYFGSSAIEAGLRPAFDSRAFVLPEHEVVNYLIWRQQDAIRNSVQALAQSLFPRSEIYGLSCLQLKTKMKADRNRDWDACKPVDKHGVVIKKIQMPRANNTLSGIWVPDFNTPNFTSDREYLDSILSKQVVPPSF